MIRTQQWPQMEELLSPNLVRTVEICPFSFDSKKSLGEESKTAAERRGAQLWALPSPHFTTIDLQEKNMKNAAQAEPSAWSLAEEAPEGTDLGSLRSSRVTGQLPSGLRARSSRWCPRSQGPLTDGVSGFHPPPPFYM